jgi:hypothetical protein
MDEKTLPRNLVTAGSTPVERMYFAWNDALSHNDADGLLALYAEDAGFESPLVPHLAGHRPGLSSRTQGNPARPSSKTVEARQELTRGELTHQRGVRNDDNFCAKIMSRRTIRLRRSPKTPARG